MHSREPLHATPPVPQRSCVYLSVKLLGEIIYEDDGCRVAIKSLDDRPESLLTCSVPDLQLHAIVVIDPDHLAFELSP